MTIDLTDNAPRVSYTVSEGATQTSFTVPFEFFDAVDLKVVVDGTTKTITTHYTVSGGNGSTGTVTMSVTGATGGSTVIIFRDIAFKRTTDFPTSGAFPIATLNTELDRNIALFDDQQDRIDRSVRLNDNDDAASMVLPLKASRVGTVLGFNATTGAAEAGPTIANVNSLADITTNINTVAGISSNVTTVAGISSNVTTVAGISSAVSSVAGVASLITSDFVSDLNTLATSAIVEDLNILATSDIVSDLNTLATTDIVSDLNTLATADIVSDLNTLATSDIVSDLNQLATSDFVSDLNAIEAIKANVTSVAGVASNVTTVAGISSNVTTVAGASSNVSTVASNISSVTSVASNISNVTTVANQLQSSSPTFTGTVSADAINVDSGKSILDQISLTFQQTEAQSNAGTLPEVVFKSKTANKEGVIQQSLGTLNLISKNSGLGNYGTIDIFVQDSDASNLTRTTSFGINETTMYKRAALRFDDALALTFGTDAEVTLSHVHNTGLLLNSTSQLQFGDSGTYIHQSADGVLDLVSDTEIEINATTIDMNGAVDVSGNATFNGTVNIGTTGSLSNNSGTFLIDANTNLNFRGGTQTFDNADGSVEYMRLNSTGLGVGVSPAYKFHQHESTSGENYHLFTNSTTGQGSSDGFRIGIDSNENALIWHREANSIQFATSNSQKMEIDSSGRVTISHVGTDTTISGGQPGLQVTGSAFDSFTSVVRREDGAFGSGLALVKSRGTTADTFSSSTKLQDNDQIGYVLFIGDDGTNLDTYGATITAQIDGTPSENNMPTELIFSTNSGSATVTERMKIGKSGEVIIGTDVGSYTSSDFNLIVSNGDQGTNILLYDDSGAYNSALITYDTNVLQLGLNNANSANTLLGDTAININASGVGVGVAPTAQLQVKGFNNSSSTPLGKIANSSLHLDHTTHLNAISQIGFGYTGASSVYSSASIGFISTDQASSGKGDLFFATRDSTSDAVPTERMRIDSSGKVLVGTSTPASFSTRLLTVGDTSFDDTVIEIRSSTGTTGRLYFTDASDTSTGAYKGAVIYDQANDFMKFETNGGNERMRIDSTGKINIGATANSAGYSAYNLMIRAASPMIKLESTSSDNCWDLYNNGGTTFIFGYNAADKASINQSTGAYTALSDANKKKDFEESNIGLEAVMQLQPKLFRMLDETSDTPKHLGFIAQEVEPIIPQAYVEETNDNDTFIGLQDRPIIAVLTKAIQEMSDKIKTLEARIAKLEGA